MAVIVGIAGSVRKSSLNAALLRAAAEVAPADCRISIESIREIPLYDGDVEQERGVPAVVSALKDRIAGAAGLLLVSPEYNNSMPGVLKNAIDWLSRPSADIPRVFGGKPVALCGATPGAGGTRLAQTAWLPVFRTLGMRPWFDKALYVASADDAFDEAGMLTDDKLRERLRGFVQGFAAFAAGR